jgi:hypothetical protein
VPQLLKARKAAWGVAPSTCTMLVCLAQENLESSVKRVSQLRHGPCTLSNQDFVDATRVDSRSAPDTSSKVAKESWKLTTLRILSQTPSRKMVCTTTWSCFRLQEERPAEGMVSVTLACCIGVHMLHSTINLNSIENQDPHVEISKVFHSGKCRLPVQDLGLAITGPRSDWTFLWERAHLFGRTLSSST